MADPIETQADGAWDPSRFRNHGEEVAAIQAEKQKVETYTCWDCGTDFTPTFPNQRECTRCYVQGKL